jgi:hypothetical protein
MQFCDGSMGIGNFRVGNVARNETRTALEETPMFDAANLDLRWE